MALNLKEIDFNDLDFDNIGSWPKVIQALLLIIVSILVIIGGYFLLIDDKITQLKQAEFTERELKNTYRIKYLAVANLDALKEQLRTMEQEFTQLLKKLPTSDETPGLLDDITHSGNVSGLTFVRLEWLTEKEKEFYTELPIQVEAIGQYHNFALFMSKIAQLSRIVTIHDFKITRLESGLLALSLTAKTYRYHQDSV